MARIIKSPIGKLSGKAGDLVFKTVKKLQLCEFVTCAYQKETHRGTTVATQQNDRGHGIYEAFSAGV